MLYSGSHVTYSPLNLQGAREICSEGWWHMKTPHYFFYVLKLKFADFCGRAFSANVLWCNCLQNSFSSWFDILILNIFYIESLSRCLIDMIADVYDTWYRRSCYYPLCALTHWTLQHNHLRKTSLHAQPLQTVWIWCIVYQCVIYVTSVYHQCFVLLNIGHSNKNVKSLKVGIAKLGEVEHTPLVEDLNLTKPSHQRKKKSRKLKFGAKFRPVKNIGRALKTHQSWNIEDWDQSSTERGWDHNPPMQWGSVARRPMRMWMIDQSIPCCRMLTVAA